MNYLRGSRIGIEHRGADTPRFASRIRTLASRTITTLLPQACALCDGWSGRWPVCPGCTAILPQQPVPCCPRCGDRSDTGDVCARCLAEPIAFDAVIAAFAYAPPIDDLVHRLKYGHQIHLADWFGDRLADRLADRPDLTPPALVVPMPLHPERIAERGFNQAVEIARPLTRRLGATLKSELVRRVRPTPPQAQQPLAERHANVRHAFECARPLDGRDVLLVDDVMTSGASLGELARTLRLAGAGRVVAAVAARTLR